MITTKQINEIFNIVTQLKNANYQYEKTKKLTQNNNTKSIVNSQNFKSALFDFNIAVANFDEWINNYNPNNFDYPFSKKPNKDTLIELKNNINDIINQFIENSDNN